jgi:hypothetical protein
MDAREFDLFIIGIGGDEVIKLLTRSLARRGALQPKLEGLGPCDDRAPTHDTASRRASNHCLMSQMR